MPRKDRDKKILPFQPQAAPEILFKKIHSAEGKFASFVSYFSGNMWFVYLHVVWFTFWILANKGEIPGIEPFDPFPYGLLTMIVSLEAIFLSTFILINQNRQALLDTYRELEEEEESEAQEEDVEDIQKDIDSIKNALNYIQGKLTNVEKAQGTNGGEHH